MNAQTQVTQLLESAAKGDRVATESLFPLVYDELRRLASGLMAGEKGKGPYTLQPTALVHEAYMKLVGPGAIGWGGRAQFFAAAARAMRWILIDRARRVSTSKEKGPRELNESMIPAFASQTPQESAAEEMIALDAAMERLKARDERQHEVVMLRFFAGLTIEQTSDVMELSPATIKNEWSYARAWLLRELDQERRS